MSPGLASGRGRARLAIAGAVQHLAAARSQYLAIGGVLIVAILLRFVNLSSIPLPLADEVFAAVDWHSIISTGHHFDGSRAGTLAYIVALLDGRLVAFSISNGSLMSLRIVSAVFG